MKGLIQRVSEASITVDGGQIAAIGSGLLLLLGIERGDGKSHVAALCRKILAYRVFPDDQGKMNKSLMDTNGSLLIVPQFTLAADTSSGTRPGFSPAAEPDEAQKLYQLFIREARSVLGLNQVAEGQFGADMKVQLINDGPVTFMLHQ
ncbi:MAG TPA: D-aminoacyl-tRNA deacylase [Marinobacter sp.]|nr:D-aminoacyl-tRNA deacylase [Marinobacter sp.]